MSMLALTQHLIAGQIAGQIAAAGERRMNTGDVPDTPENRAYIARHYRIEREHYGAFWMWSDYFPPANDDSYDHPTFQA